MRVFFYSRFFRKKKHKFSLVFIVIFFLKNRSRSKTFFFRENKNHVKLDINNVPNHNICLIVK